MTARFLGIVIGCVFFLISCRYKDNDKFVLSTVKHRIEKTWYLKEYVLNGVNSFVSANNTITFYDMKKNSVSIGIDNYSMGSLYLFKNNKTTIVKDEADNRSLKITKLTKDELWFEGDRIIPTLGFNSDDKIKAKYSSKK
jgi:hypothetical protein